MVLYSYEEEKQALLEEKKRLEKEIFRVKEAESLKRAKRFAFDDFKSAYRRMPIRFLKTVFHTRRDELLTYASFTFDPFMIQRLYEHMRDCNLQEVTVYMTLYCEEMKPCKQGYLFTLSDPYKKVEVFIEKLPDKFRDKDIRHHILQAKVLIRKDFFTAGKISAEYVYPLPYTLECDATDGEPRPIETVDYETLKPLEENRGITNQAACLRMAQQLVADGAHRALPDEQKEELQRGFLYIRGMYKKYFLFFKGNEIEAMVYECGGLTEYEIKHWNDSLCLYQRHYDITYKIALS